MSSTYGENIRVTVFGQSHSAGIGVTIEGIPAGNEIDFERLNAFLARRAPGQNAWSTARKEADQPEFLSGVFEGKTCGTPITAVIRNNDTRSKDYTQLKIIPRPGHADYTAEIKYHGCQDYRGGGHFSGRLTAPLCVAGGICLQLLEREGIHVLSRIASIGDVEDEGELTESTAAKEFPVVSDERGAAMRELIAAKRAEGDSGINGGITNGMPLTFRAAFKPTPSIAKAQESVNLSTNENTVLEISGRHDPCIVPRAVPVVEAAAAIAVYDALLSRKKEIN